MTVGLQPLSLPLSFIQERWLARNRPYSNFTPAQGNSSTDRRSSISCRHKYKMCRMHAMHLSDVSLLSLPPLHFQHQNPTLLSSAQFKKQRSLRTPTRKARKKAVKNLCIHSFILKTVGKYQIRTVLMQDIQHHFIQFHTFPPPISCDVTWLLLQVTAASTSSPETRPQHPSYRPH